MYLPSIAYYRRLIASGSLELAAAGDTPNRTTIRGAWGEQTLVVPIAGGRRRLLSTPAEDLQVSEHGAWRHSHLQAITSAYGSLPYFHYLIAHFESIYSHPAQSFMSLCEQLHRGTLEAARLPELLDWLRDNPRSLPRPADYDAIPEHIAAIELLFAHGPESIFYLLPQ